MKRASSPGPHHGAQTLTEPPLRLRDIVEALCAGLTPSAAGLEIALDRIEGART